MITTIVSDFGGVLTNPLWEAFERVQRMVDVPPAALNAAIGRIHDRSGVHPLHALERGEMSEPDFMGALAREVSVELGRPVDLERFSEHYFDGLCPNEVMLAEMERLRDAGYRMGLLTNNVREWEPRWRPMLPVDALFGVVVDSAFVGMRKPERGIYELTCERLGVPPSECVLIDDFQNNCEAAREVGMHAVVFQDTDQAIGELRELLDRIGSPPGIGTTT